MDIEKQLFKRDLILSIRKNDRIKVLGTDSHEKKVTWLENFDKQSYN